MDYSLLANAVGRSAALRRRQRLQPVGGKGDKIFPPTYPEERRGTGPRHVFERRRIDGVEVWCALVDSPQSQASSAYSPGGKSWGLIEAREWDFKR
jgi:CRISPR-associated protein Csb1